MSFIRIKKIVLKTGSSLLLGSILFLFEQIPIDGILYGAEPLPSTVAPFRYKIPPPPSPTVTAEPQSLPEQQTVSTKNSPSFDSTVIEQPTPAADHPDDRVKPPESSTGNHPKGERRPAAAASKSGTQSTSKSRLKSEPLSSKASAVSSSAQKILEIESDLTSPSAEMITIVLTGSFPPETQVIEGKTPKIICDFPNVRMEKNIKRMIPINGKYILQVRTGIHPPPEPKTRVVIDLAPNHDYEVEQLFYEKNNRYSMIIREKP